MLNEENTYFYNERVKTADYWGDSIVIRINEEKISEIVLGDHKSSGLVERVKNKKPGNFKQVSTLIGKIDRLSNELHAKETLSIIENFFLYINHKFTSQIISLCTAPPLGAIKKDFNANVQKLNKRFSNFDNNLKDLGDVRLDILHSNHLFFFPTEKLKVSHNFLQNISKDNKEGRHFSKHYFLWDIL